VEVVGDYPGRGVFRPAGAGQGSGPALVVHRAVRGAAGVFWPSACELCVRQESTVIGKRVWS